MLLSKENAKCCVSFSFFFFRLKLKGDSFAKQNKLVKSRHLLSLNGKIEDRRRNDGQNDRCDRS